MAQIRAGWKPARAFLVTAAMEGGWVARELAGLVARSPDVVVTGSWVALSLGLGFDGPLR
jgi:hypothetical protein